MRLAVSSLVAGLVLAANPAQAQQSWESREAERLAWPQLRTFENDADFRAYVRAVRQARRRMAQGDAVADPLADSGAGPVIVVAQADLNTIECSDPDLCPPLEDDDETAIVVTGSRISSPAMSAPVAVTSITNNQVSAVDEGDIVKRIGDYLLVLQDGRIMVLNWRDFRLTDRADVYRRDEDGDEIGADWYDEMLVQGDNILVTAYSYEDDATEISVFALDQANGRITPRGVFLISSDDYYDVDNYATRVVGDQLVIYTPYEPDQLVSRRDRPVIRRWVPGDEFDEARGTPMLDAGDIYRPVQGTVDPWVHTVSLCPLDRLDDQGLACTSTAFIAGREAEMFVSGENVFLATTPAGEEDLDSYYGECERTLPGTNARAPGTIYRVPLDGRSEPDLLPVRGVVNDQFAMVQDGAMFRAVLGWPGEHTCAEGSEELDLFRPELVSQPIGAFTDTWRRPPERRFAQLPPIAGRVFENRFAGDWLIYGTRNSYSRPRPADELLAGPRAYAVPKDRPADAAMLPLEHEVLRIEALGSDAVLTGYGEEYGLRVTYLDLGQEARIADSTLLPGRLESEGRSHAFNATIHAAGDGLMGIPTVSQPGIATRMPWRSIASDLSFLSFSPQGDLADLGAIKRNPVKGREKTGYSCEVSCTDWYGNTRPIFIEDRIFALMGTDLVEAEVRDDAVRQRRYIDMTAPLEQTSR